MIEILIVKEMNETVDKIKIFKVQGLNYKYLKVVLNQETMIKDDNESIRWKDEG